MEHMVVRQPVFDRNQAVFGYKLICSSHRLGSESSPAHPDASVTEIESTLFLIGFDKITRGKKAFIDLTRSLFDGSTEVSLPKDATIVEISYCLDAIDTLVRSCRQFKEAGYTLAADSSLMQHGGLAPLHPLVDMIKMKLDEKEPGPRRAPETASRAGVRFVAEKVNSREAFELALNAGFDYFHGYFFSDPVIIAERDIPQYELSQLRILHEVNRPDLSYKSLENVIKQDVSLSYRLLRYINAPFFGFRSEVSSIKQALSLLGEREIRRWASQVVVTGLGKSKPAELVVASLIRANFCETLAVSLGLKDRRHELFMLGLFSMLDAILGRPMQVILEDMPLAPDIKNVLLGKKSRYTALFDLVVSYERGNIRKFVALASKLGIREGAITGLYMNSIERAEDSLQLYGPEKTVTATHG